MDREVLTARLREAARVAKSQLTTLPAFPHSPLLKIPRDTAGSFGRDLLEVPAIRSLNEVSFTIGTVKFEIDLLRDAAFLIHRATQIDAQEVIEDLFRIAASRTITLKRVWCIDGVATDQEIDLGTGMSVVPPSSLPNEFWLNAVFSPKANLHDGKLDPPTSAIVFTQEQDFMSQTVSHPKTAVPLHTTRKKKIIESVRRHPSELAESALSAVTLASGAAPQLREQLLLIASPGWPGLRVQGYSLTDYVLGYSPLVHSIDGHIATISYQKLKKGNDAVGLAIKQLASSRRRSRPTEKAIDIGTCLEILLMQGADDNTEITFKLASRAAWLIGQDAETRLIIFKRAQELYKLRSQAVHSGKFKRARGGIEEEVAKELKLYDELCVRIIFKMLSCGVPNWVELVLGFDQSVTNLGNDSS
jgi:hypothetical protein